MAKLQIYSAKGARLGTTEFPKRFSEKENLKLLAQAIHVYQDRLHPGTSKVKTRGEVRASTVKIWRQKGTGRARHGARSAPIFVGGGVAHGPKGVKRELTLPRKMRQRALNVALSLMANQGRLLLADKLETIKKTKDAQKLLNSISEKEFKGKLPAKVLIALSKNNMVLKRYIQNIKNTLVIPFEELNAYAVFFAGVLIIDKEALIPGKKDSDKTRRKTQEQRIKKEKIAKSSKSAKRKVEKKK